MNFSVKVVLFVLLCVSASVYSTENSDETFLLNLVWKCSKSEDLGNCLKAKAAKVLDDLVQMNEPLVITDYLSLAKDPKYSGVNFRGINESEAELGRSKEGQGEFLDRMIWNKLGLLFTTRTIQVSLPSGAFEGRGKEDKIFKKGHGFFLMAAMMGGMMMKMALGKIALIAGKALILGKIALVLSLIIALKKFSGQGGGGQSEVVYTSEQVGGREFGGDSQWSADGIDLAYFAHKPEALNKL